MNTAELLKSIRSMVAYHQSCGIEYYRRSARLDTGLQQLERVAAEARTGAGKAAAAMIDGAVVEATGSAAGAVTG